MFPAFAAASAPANTQINAALSNHGAVAQLGERYNGIVEVVGSIPSGSTNLFNDLAIYS